ncbi:MAG: hypothetical protein GY748_16085 [Planctomycetaceae bacterium]|nr:hypothetical protein [Planctomycetaceae bacterium]
MSNDFKSLSYIAEELRRRTGHSTKDIHGLLRDGVVSGGVKYRKGDEGVPRYYGDHTSEYRDTTRAVNSQYESDYNVLEIKSDYNVLDIETAGESDHQYNQGSESSIFEGEERIFNDPAYVFEVDPLWNFVSQYLNEWGSSIPTWNEVQKPHSRRSAGGRPAKYDWEKFAVAFMLHIFEVGLPESKALAPSVLVNWGLDWWEKHSPGKVPQKSQIGTHIEQYIAEYRDTLRE